MTRKARLELLLLAVSVLWAAVLSESASYHYLDSTLAGRRCDFYLAPISEEQVRDLTNPRLYHIFSPTLGWDVHPNYRDNDRAASTYVQTNNIGSRNFENWQPSDRVAVASYGDSFAFGVDVRNEESWPQLLQEHLGRKVLNLGIVGGDPVQALLKYRAAPERLHADYVFLTIMTENIARVPTGYSQFYVRHLQRLTKPSIQIKDGQPELVPNPITDPRRVGELLNDIKFLRNIGGDDYWFQYYDRFGLNEFEHFPYTWLLLKNCYCMWKTGTQQHYIQMYEEEGPRRCLEEAVRLFALEAERRKQKLVVLLMPCRYDLDRLDQTHGSPVALLVPSLQRAGIAFVDLTPDIYQARLKSKSIKDLFVGGIGHYTPFGNRVVATRLAAYLRGR